MSLVVMIFLNIIFPQSWMGETLKKIKFYPIKIFLNHFIYYYKKCEEHVTELHYNNICLF